MSCSHPFEEVVLERISDTTDDIEVEGWCVSCGSNVVATFELTDVRGYGQQTLGGA